ncbi:MAG: AzlD domain-containing protein [Alphaproteobacteria bacterium]|nr:AzlD domain-containing protein [Alphaproteobacteria bacterium]
MQAFWPYIFIAIAGWLATDIWRWLGVLLGKRLLEESIALIWIRAVATALVAAVIARLLLYPSGALAATPVTLRVGAALAGFLAFLVFRQRVVVGIVVSEAVFLGGAWFGLR